MRMTDVFATVDEVDQIQEALAPQRVVEAGGSLPDPNYLTDSFAAAHGLPEGHYGIDLGTGEFVELGTVTEEHS